MTEDINKDVRDLAQQNLQLILEETTKTEPKSKILNSLYKSLKFAANSVPSAVALMEGVNKLEELIKPFL